MSAGKTVSWGYCKQLGLRCRIGFDDMAVTLEISRACLGKLVSKANRHFAESLPWSIGGLARI